MCGGTDLIIQFLLGAAELLRRPQIPAPLLQGEIRLQNDHILRPADPPGLHCQFGSIFVGAVELPHPAQIAGGETTRFRVCGLEIFRGGHRRPLLRSGADSPANFKVQLHLRQIYCHELIQYSIHSTVICGLSDVHSLLLSGAVRLLSPVSCNGNAPYAMRSRFGSLQFSVYPCFWNQLLSISATSSSGIFVPSVRASILWIASSLFSRPVAVR